MFAQRSACCSSEDNLTIVYGCVIAVWFNNAA